MSTHVQEGPEPLRHPKTRVRRALVLSIADGFRSDRTGRASYYLRQKQIDEALALAPTYGEAASHYQNPSQLLGFYYRAVIDQTKAVWESKHGPCPGRHQVRCSVT